MIEGLAAWTVRQYLECSETGIRQHPEQGSRAQRPKTGWKEQGHVQLEEVGWIRAIGVSLVSSSESSYLSPCTPLS